MGNNSEDTAVSLQQIDNVLLIFSTLIPLDESFSIEISVTSHHLKQKYERLGFHELVVH